MVPIDLSASQIPGTHIDQIGSRKSRRLERWLMLEFFGGFKDVSRVVQWYLGWSPLLLLDDPYYGSWNHISIEAPTRAGDSLPGRQMTRPGSPKFCHGALRKRQNIIAIHVTKSGRTGKNLAARRYQEHRQDPENCGCRYSTWPLVSGYRAEESGSQSRESMVANSLILFKKCECLSCLICFPFFAIYLPHVFLFL